jgi:ABC-2 type transport system ATP-binding protein
MSQDTNPKVFINIMALTKKYQNIVAVDNISMQILEGEILGILGPNGAGKSTTISLISSLLTPTAGDILLHGTSIIKNYHELRKILGVVPQEIALYPDLTGTENLLFFGRAYGLSGQTLKKRLSEVLDIIGLSDRADQQIATYSGGMKRRVNVGCALMHRPKLLIMDEPTVGIDPQSRNHILETVKDLNREGMTVVYTSHYMEEVEFLCQLIYIMDHGKIIAAGTKEELKTLVVQENTIQLQVDIVKHELVEMLAQLDWVKQVLPQNQTIAIIGEKNGHGVTQVFNIAHQLGVNISSLSIKDPSLEDVFLSLTGRGLRN